MRNLSRLSILVALLWVASIGTAEACYCGITRLRCPRVCCQPTCQMQYCTVMTTCQKVVYEEKECTFYKTVFEDVVDKKTVPATKFVEDTAYRCAPFTGYVPKPAAACESAKPACAPATCGAPCNEMMSVQCLRKVPYTTFREEAAEKVEEVPRVVEKQVPYTVICCIPKTICVQVPVTVCCPVPCCAKPPCAVPANKGCSE
jgi:hypothetical protein